MQAFPSVVVRLFNKHPSAVPGTEADFILNQCDHEFSSHPISLLRALCFVLYPSSSLFSFFPWPLFPLASAVTNDLTVKNRSDLRGPRAQYTHTADEQSQPSLERGSLEAAPGWQQRDPDRQLPPEHPFHSTSKVALCLCVPYS